MKKNACDFKIFMKSEGCAIEGKKIAYIQNI